MMRIPLVVALLVTGACGGTTARDTTATPVRAAPGATAFPDTGRVVTGDFQSAHGARSYRLYVPAGQRARPLVVMLHGCAQTAADLALAGRFDSLGAEHGALVLYPEQPATANPLRCWNWFIPANQARDAGEPGIIAELTRHIVAEHGADPARVYIGGLSAGGAMAVLTALAYPDLFTAAGTHSGVGWRVAGDVPAAFTAMRGGGVDAPAQAAAAHEAMGRHGRVVPLIAFHGTEDTLAHPSATEGLVQQFVALHELAADGAELRTDTVRRDVGGYPVEIRRYADDDGVVIEHWRVEGLAHALSGGDPAARWTDPRGPDAAGEMLRFFLRYRR